MKKIIDSYKNISPVLLLYVYLIGYSILTTYYGMFDIEIIYYLALSDIIFITLKYTLIGVILFALFIIILEFLASAVAFFYKNEQRQLKFTKTIPSAILSFLVIGSYFLGDYYGYIYNYIPIIFIIILFIYLTFAQPLIFYITPNFNDIKLPKKKWILASLFMIFLGSMVIGQFEALTIQKKESFMFSKHFEFKYENVFFSTKNNKNLNFIGETKDVLFIYDKLNKETLIFYKSNLKQLKLTKNYKLKVK